MDDDGDLMDMIIPMLQRMQADVTGIKTDVAVLKTDVAELKADVAELKTDVAELKADVVGLKTAVHETNARLSAHMDMTETRFMAVEHAILDIGARTYSTSTQREDTTKRHDRELAELRERVSRLEGRSEP